VQSTSVQFTYADYSTTYCITVTATNNQSVTGPASAQACATTGAAPPPPVSFTVSAGPAAPPTTVDCQLDPACRWWSFTESNIPVGTYTLTCFDTTDGDFGVQFTIDITSSSWSFVSDGTTGYCASAVSGRTVHAVLTGAPGTYPSDDFVWP
jgi:hypothetical protein